MEAKVTGLRGVELGVKDLKTAVAFYSDVWGLEEVCADSDTAYLRGTGTEHHVLTLRERPHPGLLAVHFAAPSRNAVRGLYAKAKSFGAKVGDEPRELPRAAGAGFGFSFETPEGHPLTISSGVNSHANVINDRSRPAKLSHVVLNSAQVAPQTEFFIDLLGFRLSDATQIMNFVRCSADHHSIAVARGSGPSLNHMAYEMKNFDGLMHGSGRMKQNGFDIEWGIGRHGPGDNIFAYFVEPNGFVAEYTTEIQQIDEINYVPGTPDYWANFPARPCRWNMATRASNRVRAAMAGQLPEGDAETSERCETIMAKTLGH